MSTIVELTKNCVEMAIKAEQMTKEYCAVGSLDVKNCFNSASWKQSATALATVGILTSLRNIVLNSFKARRRIYTRYEVHKPNTIFLQVRVETYTIFSTTFRFSAY